MTTCEHGFAIGIPVYNEEEILVANVERLAAHCADLGEEFEIIIASNGSTDATVELAEELTNRDPRIVFFHLGRKGVGLAFREIVRRCRYHR